MGKKLFGKSISPKCGYCEHSNTTIKPGAVFCNYKGIISDTGKCRKFKYDPLKRVPKIAHEIEVPDSNIFSLNESEKIK